MENVEYNFIAIKGPLKFPVWSDGQIVIPKGTVGVEFAPKQSSKTFVDKSTGKTIQQNVYRWNGEIYNA